MFLRPSRALTPEVIYRSQMFRKKRKEKLYTFYGQCTFSVSIACFEIIRERERSCQNCYDMRKFPNLFALLLQKTRYNNKSTEQKNRKGCTSLAQTGFLISVTELFSRRKVPECFSIVCRHQINKKKLLTKLLTGAGIAQSV
jgi:hypothetical protein